MSFTSFILSAVAILLTPGPTNTLLAASGAAVGLRRALALPLAEAAGYAVAISLFFSASDILHEVPAAMAILKATAAAWLLFSASRLWRQPVVPSLSDHRQSFRRVFITTLLNPKAMLVATIVIPGLMAGYRMQALLIFIALSTCAGMAWTAFRAMLPARIRRHSYKAAAMVLVGFAIFASAGALQT